MPQQALQALIVSSWLFGTPWTLSSSATHSASYISDVTMARYLLHISCMASPVRPSGRRNGVVGGETGMRNMRVGCQHRPRVSRQQLRRHAVGAVDRTVDD